MGCDAQLHPMHQANTGHIGRFRAKGNQARRTPALQHRHKHVPGPREVRLITTRSNPTPAAAAAFGKDRS
jgi:hypothetical protein